MAQILAQSQTLLQRYEQAAQRHPISTKVATCFVGFAAGDVVAQCISRPVRVRITSEGLISGTETLREKVEIDFFRALRMALFGALIAAPQMHVFHGWMEKVSYCCSAWFGFTVACCVPHVPGCFTCPLATVDTSRAILLQCVIEILRVPCSLWLILLCFLYFPLTRADAPCRQ